VAVVYAAVTQGRLATPLELLPSEASAQTLLAGMPTGVEYDSVTVAAVSVDDPVIAVTVALVNASLYLLAAAILWLLSKVFHDAEKGHPFSIVNVRRMRAAAWLTVVAALMSFYAKPLTMAWASSQIGDGSWSVQATFAPFFVAVAVFALATIWQRGAELADLEEHTV